MLKIVSGCLVTAVLGLGAAMQDSTPSPAKPTEHLIGTVQSVDPSTHSISIKDDKSGATETILLADTKTLLKVAPGAKDLKTATRITSDDLTVGDRVDVRGMKSPDAADKIAARSVVLMSGRDLQQAHQKEAAEWQHSTNGVVTAVDAGNGKLTARIRTPTGPQPITVDTSKTTEFTRYTPAASASPAASQLSDIQVGDQVRVLGEKAADGSSIVASKVYSGAFRTLNGTVTAIDPAGKSLTIRDLASKAPVEIDLTDQSSIRKLPPEMALALAQRANRAGGAGAPGDHASAGAGNTQAPPGGGATPEVHSQGSTSGPGANGPGGNGPGGNGRPGARGGDISQMIASLPKVEVSTLKPGDAVVVLGVATDATNDKLTATNVIAGVEPILQAAPSRQRSSEGGNATGGDWGLGELAPPQQ